MSKKQEVADRLYEEILTSLDNRDGKPIPPDSLKAYSEAFAKVAEHAPAGGAVY